MINEKKVSTNFFQVLGKNPQTMKKFCTNFFILLFVFLAGIFFINHTSKHFALENIKYVKIAGQNIKVDLALSDAEQELGLSRRQSLNADEGMLFVFSKPSQYRFWMKDMNFPIDMIWVNENMKVIYIKKDALPILYPESYGPNENAKYVLEVMAGFSDKNNLQIGDQVLFTY